MRLSTILLWTLSCAAASLSGCAASPPPISAACGWESIDRPSPGFETRWTREEKLWAVDHNDKVAKACGLVF